MGIHQKFKQKAMNSLLQHSPEHQHQPLNLCNQGIFNTSPQKTLKRDLISPNQEERRPTVNQVGSEVQSRQHEVSPTTLLVHDETTLGSEEQTEEAEDACGGDQSIIWTFEEQFRQVEFDSPSISFSAPTGTTNLCTVDS